jgi:hypothetical protein
MLHLSQNKFFYCSLRFDVCVFPFLQEWTAYVFFQRIITCSGSEMRIFVISEINGIGMHAEFVPVSLVYITH